MNRIKPFLKTLKLRWTEFLSKEDSYSFLASLPLFFSWLPILTWFQKSKLVRTYCLYSAINTCLFFVVLIFAQILSGLPYVGPILATLTHLVFVLIYLSISGFLIYSVRLQKNLDLPIISEWVKHLETFLAPIAQLDRVSDYGSEG